MKLNHGSELLEYLAAHAPESGKHLPSLAELTKELDLSVQILWEQFEIPRAIGFVEIQPGRAYERCDAAQMMYGLHRPIDWLGRRGRSPAQRRIEEKNQI